MRGGRNVVSRLCVVAVVGAMSAGVSAQQAVTQAPAADPQLERTKAEVRTFEMVLVQAIESAGQKLAAWAEKLVPNVILSPAADPVVNGLPIPESGLVFMVRIPELSGVTVFTRYPPFRQSQPYVTQPEPGAPTKPVSTQGSQRTDAKVTSTTVVPDDPMKTPPAGPPNPDAMYSDLVRVGLMDAMLDSSSVLSLRDGQRLTVTAVPVDVLVTNAFYKNTSRKLILSIKTEDLAAFRAGKLTREEAKLKIEEIRF